MVRENSLSQFKLLIILLNIDFLVFSNYTGWFVRIAQYSNNVQNSPDIRKPQGLTVHIEYRFLESVDIWINEERVRTDSRGQRRLKKKLTRVMYIYLPQQIGQTHIVQKDETREAI